MGTESFFLQRPPTAEQLDDEHDDRDNQEDVNPGTERGAANDAEQPENEQNNGDGPEHRDFWVNLNVPDPGVLSTTA